MKRTKIHRKTKRGNQMKQFILTFFFCIVSLNVLAVEKETIIIVKPLISLNEATIFYDGYNSSGSTVTANTSGTFQSSFKSKTECINWTKNTILVLKKSQKIIYTASCSNADLAPIYFEAGHFAGQVSYL